LAAQGPSDPVPDRSIARADAPPMIGLPNDAIGRPRARHARRECAKCPSITDALGVRLSGQIRTLGFLPLPKGVRLTRRRLRGAGKSCLASHGRIFPTETRGDTSVAQQ
jgi:hypothetical protein